MGRQPPRPAPGRTDRRHVRPDAGDPKRPRLRGRRRHAGSRQGPARIRRRLHADLQRRPRLPPRHDDAERSGFGRPDRAAHRALSHAARRQHAKRRRADQRRRRHPVVQRRQQQSQPCRHQQDADQRHGRCRRPRGRAHRDGGAVGLHLRKDRGERHHRRQSHGDRGARRHLALHAALPDHGPVASQLPHLRRPGRDESAAGVRAGLARARDRSARGQHGEHQSCGRHQRDRRPRHSQSEPSRQRRAHGPVRHPACGKSRERHGRHEPVDVTPAEQHGRRFERRPEH